METEKPKAKVPLRRRVLRELLSWFWVIAAFLLIQGTLMQARVIPSSSMERTLLIGDHLLVSRIGYDIGLPYTEWHRRLWREPRRQQVVIFRPPIPGAPDYVKRLIGLPGDRLEIRSGVVWINGKPLAEPYLTAPMSRRENFDPVTVPPASYFVMGDNRADSYDSRYWGFVPRAGLIGTPVLIYMSIDAPEQAWQPGEVRARIGAYLSALAHPSRVRWNRLFETF